MPDLLASGYTPRQVLVGLGLGRLLPFVILGTAFWVLNLLFAVPMLASTTLRGGIGFAVFGRAVLLNTGVAVVVTPLLWLLSASVTVCLSALCRRVWSAISLCYVFHLVIEPLAFLMLRYVLQPFGTKAGNFWIPLAAGSVLLLLFQGIFLALLAPVAVATLRGEGIHAPDAAEFALGVKADS